MVALERRREGRGVVSRWGRSAVGRPSKHEGRVSFILVEVGALHSLQCFGSIVLVGRQEGHTACRNLLQGADPDEEIILVKQSQ